MELRDYSGYWPSFARAADEWVVAYACLPFSVLGIQQFTIGHAVELYLKALRTKLTGDFEGSVRRGHRIDLLLKDIRRADPAALTGYEVRDHLRLLYPANGAALESLSAGDRLHYLSNIELYAVAKELTDLKYWGVPKLGQTGPTMRTWIFPNPYWSQFANHVRAELGYPKSADPIAATLEEGDITLRAAHFLLEVLGDEG